MENNDTPLGVLRDVMDLYKSVSHMLYHATCGSDDEPRRPAQAATTHPVKPAKTLKQR